MATILYYDKNKLCSKIIYTTPSEPVRVENYTDDFIQRAFGNNEHPTWNDLEEFLKTRCVPEARENIKELVDYLNIGYYDPFAITRVTGGKKAEDDQWLEYEEER